MTEKICNTCDKTKNISEYSIRDSIKNTYHNRCKECTNNYARGYREENQNIVVRVERFWQGTPLSNRVDSASNQRHLNESNQKTILLS